MDWKVDAEKSKGPSRRCAWPSRRTRAITHPDAPDGIVAPAARRAGKSAEVANQHRQRADGSARQPGAELTPEQLDMALDGAAADARLNPAQDRAAALVFALALPDVQGVLVWAHRRLSSWSGTRVNGPKAS